MLKNVFNSFIPENRYSGWENLSLHSWEPLERGRHKHSLPSGWPLQRFCLWNPQSLWNPCLSVTWSARQFPLASVTRPEECFDKLHNALISHAWPLPDCGKVSSAQNVSISRDGVRVFCTAGKCPVHRMCPFLGMGLGCSVQLESVQCTECVHF